MTTATSSLGRKLLARQVLPVVPCNLDGIPAVLKGYNNWIVWLNLPDPKSRKGFKKMPINPVTLGEASSVNPADWASYEVAQRAFLDYGFAGLGFVLTDDVPLVGIDLDYCIGEDDKFKPYAKQVLRALNTYTEMSASGNGVKALVFGRKKGSKCDKNGVEMYEKGRFFALTGEVVGGVSDQIEERQAELDSIYDTYLEPPMPEAEAAPEEPGVSVLADDELLRLARAAKNADKFVSLFDEGDLDAYDDNHSNADLGLCSMLAFWTNRDRAQMDRLFRQSALYREEKWGKREDYRERTIQKAIKDCRETYNPKAESRKLDRTLGDFEATDIGNSHRFAARHGHDVRFDATSNRWYIWNSEYWGADDSLEIKRRAQQTAQRISKEVAALPFSVDEEGNVYDEAGEQIVGETADALKKYHKELDKHAKYSQSVAGYNNMLKAASSHAAITIRKSDLDANPWLLTVLNGTLDLRNGNLTKHRREDLMTTITPCEYDPDAKCPTWIKFLKQIVPDREVRHYLQKAVGYTLTGETQEECFFLLYGDGQNGKSTFTNVICKLLAGYYAKTRAETVMAKKDTDNVNHLSALAALAGKRLVSVSEVGEYDRLNEALIKDMTGRDPINARFMRQDFFTFLPNFKIWMYANHHPGIVGNDRGIWRRVKAVPFTVVISDEDKDEELGAKLQAELAGILAWAVRGCFLWQDEGLEEPESIKEATKQYRESQDKVQQFLDEQTILDPCAKTSGSRIFARYLEWLTAQNENFKPTSTAFGRKLAQHGFTKTKSNGVNLYHGLRLRNFEQEAGVN